MQYCSLQQQALVLSPVTSTIGSCFHFGSISSFFLESFLFSSSILGTYRPREFMFKCHIFLPFHTVHGVLKARLLKCFIISFSSGPCFVRTFHHDPMTCLSCVALRGMAHSLIELDEAVEDSSRDGNTRPPYLPPEKPVCRSGSNS